MQGKTYILAGVAALVSISGAGYSGYTQVDDANALQAGTNAALAPVPPGILPANTKLLAQPRPMTAVQRRELGRAASHTPLDQEIFNLFYANQVRSDVSVEQLRRQARHLSELGWRYTPAQQNLILRDMLDTDFHTIVDRADSLIRRQKMPEFAFAILSAMEAIPEIQPDVIRKLRSNPSWRRDYLSVIMPGSPPALLTARVRTINALLDSPSGIARIEAAQSLTSLIESGRGRLAQQLWRRLGGYTDRGNLVYDPMFSHAAVLAGTGDPTVAFDWQFGQNLGFSATPSAEGAVIDWDHRGAPTFMTQTVAIPSGRSLVLTIKGSADQSEISKSLRVTLECAGKIIQFTGSATSSGARYYSPVVPEDCDMGILGIGGVVDSAKNQSAIRVKKVDLRPL